MCSREMESGEQKPTEEKRDEKKSYVDGLRACLDIWDK